MTTTLPPDVHTPDDIRAIPDLRARFDAVEPARVAHLAAIAELARIPREIVAELREQKLTHAEIAEVLSITRQRAQQLSMTEEEVAAADQRAREITRERVRQRQAQREAEVRKLQGQVVKLREQGLTHAEVAGKLGISVSRSQQLAKRAAGE